MKNLPIEISCQIFRLLHQRDKLECMVVCHEWQRAINSTVLFDTLQITSKKGLKSAITRVTEEPFYGMQAKRLILGVKPDNDFDVSLLPKFFPNVEECHLDPSIFVGTNTFQPWHSKLRRFIEMPGYRIEPLIESSTWFRLTTLELAGGSNNYDAKGYIPMLANTPALRHLKLLEMDFTLSDFESLHNTSPLLESISFIDTFFGVIDPLMDAVRASSVTSLSISDSGVNELPHRKALLFYISQKYPSLSELSIDIIIVNNHDFNDTDIPYDGWDRVWSNLSPCLKKLEIGLLSQNEYNYVLQALYKNDCRLESLTLKYMPHLNIDDLLTGWNQAKYLLSLHLTAPVYSNYKWLESLCMLTEIHIDSYFNTAGKKTLQMNEFLEMCGDNLESLSFANLSFDYNPLTASNTPPSVYHQIKKLEFVDITLPYDIDTFISRSFPQLHTLKFERCFNAKDEKRYLMLPKINLHYLHVLDVFDLDDYVSVLTVCNNENSMYTTTRSRQGSLILEEHFGLRDAATNPPIISAPFGSKPVSPFLTIICNSLKDIVLFGN